MAAAAVILPPGGTDAINLAYNNRLRSGIAQQIAPRLRDYVADPRRIEVSYPNRDGNTQLVHPTGPFAYGHLGPDGVVNPPAPNDAYPLRAISQVYTPVIPNNNVDPDRLSTATPDASVKVHELRDAMMKEFEDIVIQGNGTITIGEAQRLFQSVLYNIINDTTFTHNNEVEALSSDDARVYARPNINMRLVETSNTNAYTADNVTINNLNSNVAAFPTPDYEVPPAVAPTNLHDQNNRTVEIQRRLDACFYLEHLYINKHNEILKLFYFIRLIFQKFQQTLRILLYVLAVLKKNGSLGPTIVQLPKAVIPNISALIAEQDIIMKAVSNIGESVTNTNNIINPDRANQLILPQPP